MPRWPVHRHVVSPTLADLARDAARLDRDDTFAAAVGSLSDLAPHAGVGTPGGSPRAEAPAGLASLIRVFDSARLEVLFAVAGDFQPCLEDLRRQLAEQHAAAGTGIAPRSAQNAPEPDDGLRSLLSRRAGIALTLVALVGGAILNDRVFGPRFPSLHLAGWLVSVAAEAVPAGIAMWLATLIYRRIRVQRFDPLLRPGRVRMATASVATAVPLAFVLVVGLVLSQVALAIGRHEALGGSLALSGVSFLLGLLATALPGVVLLDRLLGHVDRQRRRHRQQCCDEEEWERQRRQAIAVLEVEIREVQSAAAIDAGRRLAELDQEIHRAGQIYTATRYREPREDW